MCTSHDVAALFHFRMRKWITVAGIFVRRVPLRPRTVTSAFWPDKCFREMERVPACVKAPYATRLPAREINLPVRSYHFSVW